MTPYTAGHGEYHEANGIRVEIYHDGSWIVYTLHGVPFRSLSSAKLGGAKDLEGAKELARVAFVDLRKALVDAGK